MLADTQNPFVKSLLESLGIDRSRAKDVNIFIPDNGSIEVSVNYYVNESELNYLESLIPKRDTYDINSEELKRRINDEISLRINGGKLSE